MMISKTQISKRISKKKNLELVETIELAKKNNLLDLAKRLSSPKSNYTNPNLSELDRIKEDKIIVVGRVLGQGECGKKQISALGFSEQAREKLKKAGSETNTIKQEIEKNPGLEGVKVI